MTVMFKIRPSSFTVWTAILFGAFTIAACSLKPVDQATVRLEVEGRGPPALSDAKWPIEFTSAPTSINDMSCVMLNVMAPDIHPLKEISRDSAYDFNYQYPKLLNGDPCASYAGIISKFVALGTQNATVEVNVPTGTKRLIQVLGTKTSADFGCPDESYVDSLRRLGRTDLDLKVPDLYEVSRTQTDVLGDVNLSLSNAYTQIDPKQVTHCGGSGSSGGNGTYYEGKLELGFLSVALEQPNATPSSWPNTRPSYNPTFGPSALAQGNINYQPISSGGALTFNPSGNPKYMEATGSMGALNSSDFTYIFALNIHAGTSFIRTIFEAYGTGSTSMVRGLYENADGSGNITLGFMENGSPGSSGGTNQTVGTGVIATGVWHIITLAGTSFPGKSQIRVDGKKYVEGDWDSTVIDSIQTVRLSAPAVITVPLNTSTFYGDVGDVLLYGSYLVGLPYIQNSECYLAKRWGISAQMDNCKN